MLFSRGLASERGQALLETAVTLPLVLLVSVSIFEFGRAYQTSQVITNAAREGARVAVLPSSTDADVQSRVTAYLQNGHLGNLNTVTVSIDRNTTVAVGASTATTSTVTVNYPFSFMPEEMAKASASGSATSPTVTPAVRSANARLRS